METENISMKFFIQKRQSIRKKKKKAIIWWLELRAEMEEIQFQAGL